MKNRAFLPWVALAFLCVAPAAKAQTNTSNAPQGANAGKVAVVRMRDALQSTAEGKQAMAEIQSTLIAPRQSEMAAVQKQIDDLNKKYQAGQNTLSEDEKARMQRQGDLLTNKLKRMTDELQDEAGAAQADAVDRLGKRLMDVVHNYATENGYGVVIDGSNQQTMLVLYASKQVDITDEIVKLYDQQFPVRTTPAPAPKQPGQQQQQPPAKRPGGPGQQ